MKYHSPNRRESRAILAGRAITPGVASDRHDRRKDQALYRRALRRPTTRAAIILADFLTPDRSGPIALTPTFSATLRSMPLVAT